MGKYIKKCLAYILLLAATSLTALSLTTYIIDQKEWLDSTYQMGPVTLTKSPNLGFNLTYKNHNSFHVGVLFNKLYSSTNYWIDKTKSIPTTTFDGIIFKYVAEKNTPMGVCGGDVKFVYDDNGNIVSSYFESDLNSGYALDSDYVNTNNNNQHQKLVRITFPILSTVVILLTYPFLILIYPLFRSRYRRLHGLCIGCGYDLRGSTANKCSECGKVT